MVQWMNSGKTNAHATRQEEINEMVKNVLSQWHTKGSSLDFMGKNECKHLFMLSGLMHILIEWNQNALNREICLNQGKYLNSHGRGIIGTKR